MTEVAGRRARGRWLQGRKLVDLVVHWTANVGAASGKILANTWTNLQHCYEIPRAVFTSVSMYICMRAYGTFIVR